MQATHAGLRKPVLYPFHFSSWDICSTEVQRQGCTFYDLFIQVLQFPYWTQYNTYDLTQQRYREVIDSLQHLCNYIEPGGKLLGGPV